MSHQLQMERKHGSWRTCGQMCGVTTRVATPATRESAAESRPSNSRLRWSTVSLEVSQPCRVTCGAPRAYRYPRASGYTAFFLFAFSLVFFIFHRLVVRCPSSPGLFGLRRFERNIHVSRGVTRFILATHVTGAGVIPALPPHTLDHRPHAAPRARIPHPCPVPRSGRCVVTAWLPEQGARVALDRRFAAGLHCTSALPPPRPQTLTECSRAHFFITRLRYSTWGLRDDLSIPMTSRRVSLRSFWAMTIWEAPTCDKGVRRCEKGVRR